MVHEGKLQALGDGVVVEGNGLVVVIGDWVVVPQLLVVPPPIRSDQGLKITLVIILDLKLSHSYQALVFHEL